MAEEKAARKRASDASVTPDAVEFKRREEQLRVLSRAVEISPSVVVITDTNGKIEYVNPMFTAVTGYTPEEVIGKQASRLGERSPEEVRRLMETLASGGVWRGEFRNKRKNGEVYWVSTSIWPIFSPDEAITHFLGVHEDITKRKLAEEALRESEEQFRRLAENARDIIFRYRFAPPPAYEFVSPAISAITGYSPEEFYADPNLAMKIVHPDDRRKLERMVEDPSGDPGTLRWIRRDGAIVWTEHRNVPIYDEKGNLVAVEGIVRDTTERERTEEALRESEERYRRLVELSPYAIVVHREGKMVFANSAAVELVGEADREEIVGRPIWDFVHPDYLEETKKRIQRTWPEGEKVDFVEEKLIVAGGQAIDVDMAAVPITYQGRPARQVIIRDITERKRMEGALQAAREELEDKVDSQIQQERPYRLTFRELTVLHLVADGRSDRDIAMILGISTRTAQTHLTNIYSKMGVTSRTEASVRAVREGLIG